MPLVGVGGLQKMMSWSCLELMAASGDGRKRVPESAVSRCEMSFVML